MMFRRFLSLAAYVIPSTVMMAGCGNTEPTVDAGDDAAAAVGRTFTFSPTAVDEDGDPVTYAWVMTSRPDGSSSELSGADTGNATFVPDTVGEYDFSVTVDDGDATSSADTITITARNPPVINLTANGTDVDLSGDDPIFDILPTETIDFDADTSTVAPDQTRDFQWAVSAPDDVMYAIGTSTTATLTFTLANATPDPAMPNLTALGTYDLSVTVGDNGRNDDGDLVDFTTTQDITVHVRNPPLIDIVAPGLVRAGDEVTLDASNTEIGAGGEAEYRWSITANPASSAVELSNATAATTTVTLDLIGVYDFSLVVSDGAFSSTAAVSVEAVANP